MTTKKVLRLIKLDKKIKKIYKIRNQDGGSYEDE